MKKITDTLCSTGLKTKRKLRVYKVDWKKKAVYTLMTTIITAASMAAYNGFLLCGLDWSNFNFCLEWVMAFPMAWILMNIFNPFVEKILNSLNINYYNPNYRLYRTIFTMVIMAPLMTCYVVCCHFPGKEVFWAFFGKRLMCNIPFVFLMEFLLILNCVDFLFGKLMYIRAKFA